MLLPCVLLCFLSCGKKLEDSPKDANNDISEVEQQKTIQTIDESLKQRLYLAIDSNDSLLVESALREIPSVDFLFVDGQTPVIKAIKESKASIIAKIIEKSTELNLKNKDGETALIRAIKQGNLFATRLIIKKKADLDLTDANGVSPLLHAVYTSSQQMALSLIKHGASLKASENKGEDIEALVARFGLDQLAELVPLINNHSTPSNKMLRDAIKSANTNFVEYLLINHNEYKDLMAKRNTLITAMNIDEPNKRKQMLKTLLSKGANPNHSEGVLPLIHAVEQEQLDSVNVLILYADPFLTDDLELTALHYAVEQNNYALTEKIYRNMLEKIGPANSSQLQQIVDRACRNRPRGRRALNRLPNGHENARLIRNLLVCYN